MEAVNTQIKNSFLCHTLKHMICAFTHTLHIPYCPGQAPIWCSQIKHQKLGVGGYMEKVPEWFDSPRASAHLGCEVSVQAVQITSITASPMLLRGQPDGGHNCIMIESCSIRCLQYVNFVLQVKNCYRRVYAKP